MSETVAQEIKSLEVMKFEEEMAERAGLPSPKAMSILKQVCREFVESGFAPVQFKQNPAALFMAAMRGREMGLSPAESIFETFWAAPGGRLGMYSNKMLDLMHRGGVKTEFKENGNESCVILCTPPGDHKPFLAEFHIQEAKVAGLVKPDSNWEKWPADMCKARAVSRAYRSLAGTFKGSGNFYSKEELEDMPEVQAATTSGSKAASNEATAQVEAEFDPGRRDASGTEKLAPQKPNGKVVELKPIAVEPIQPFTPPTPAVQYSVPGKPESEALAGSALWKNGPWVKAQIEGLKMRLGADRKASLVVQGYLRGFFDVKNTKDLPKESDQYETPLLRLSEIINTMPDGSGYVSLIANPESMGAATAGHLVRHVLQDYFDSKGWDADTQRLVKLLYSSLGYTNPHHFTENYLAKATRGDDKMKEQLPLTKPVSDLPQPEIQAYCRITSRVRDAANLIKLHQNGVGYQDFLRSLESQYTKQVEDIGPAEILKAVELALLNRTPSKPEEAVEELPFN